MWTIQLFGGLSAYSPQRQLTRIRTQKAASLLAYLAFHRSPQAREILLDLLWPEAEPEVGRHNLSNALSFLRHQLEPPGVPPGTVLLADRSSVQLNPAAVTVDVLEFENDLSQAQGLAQEQRLARLLGAVERYRGSLLPGYYEEWIVPEAQRLEGLFVQAVVQLVPLLLQAGKPEAALAYVQRAVSADPLSEEVTYCLMQAWAACGQPTQALRAYRQLERRLQEELDAQPSEVLLRLAAQLRKGDSSRLVSAVPESASPTEEYFAPSPSRVSRAAPQEGALAVAVARPTPRARLVGAEFLLRTTTRFFGREEEIERLGTMLSTPRTRLVTLTGSGGTGKTRLALEVAAQLVEGTDDTSVGDVPTIAVFVPLAPVTEADRLFDVILRSLGVVPAFHQNPLDQLASALEAHPNTLLVLDNFEQLAEDGALCVHDLLGKSASVKLFVTSRLRLQIEGEREFHLAPLPTSGGVQDPQELLKAPSIALFVDRAQFVRPEFQVTAHNASALAELCDQLEGIPLAIELAAAQVKVLSVGHILEQVQANRLDFLATRRRDAHARHRTLRATLDWSYALLPEPAQAFLTALSAFRGGWTLEAAGAVCALNAEETLELLTMLRDSSLVQVMDTNEGMRFLLLETIREYSQEKLSALGEDAAVRRRHRDWYLALSEAVEPQLRGAEQASWLQRLETEHANLRVALAFNDTEAQGAQAGLRLAGALHRFWDTRGDYSEGRASLGRALQREGAQKATAARAKALIGAGMLAQRQGDLVSTRALYEESLDIRRKLGDQGGIAASLSSLGNLAYSQGDYDRAQTLYEESLAIQRELGNRLGIANSLNNLGNVAFSHGDYDRAQTLFGESLAIQRALEDKGSCTISLTNLGNVAFFQGDYVTARTLYEECLVIRRELGDKGSIANALTNLGNVAYDQGDYVTARTLYEESLAISREQGNRWGVANALNSLGIVAKDQGDYKAARTQLEESLAIRREMEDKPGIANALANLGNVAYDQGDYKAAQTLYEESLALCREIGHSLLIQMLGALGHVEREVGDYTRAVTLYQESLRLLRKTGDVLTTAGSLEDFAGLAGRQGQWERAVLLLGAVEVLVATLGRTPPVSIASEYERTVAASRAALGEEVYAAAREEGRAMTQEQAVAYALEAVREPLG